MEKSKNYVLAMYDIRGKQEFIFRNPHIKEIVGGSAIVRDIFKMYLYPQAIGYSGGKGIYYGESPFTTEGLEKHIKDGYIGEVVYEGGGNLLLIFENSQTCKDITYRFSKEVMKDTSSLKVLCSYITGLNFNDWKGDRRRLQEQHQKNEAQESTIRPYASLPIVQRDYKSSQAIVDIILVAITNGQKKETIQREVTRESKAKYQKYAEEYEKNRIDDWTVVLDQIVEERGRESHLAVIYIDGNNMGNKVQICCNNCKSYEECVRELRRFSRMIQEIYLDERKEEIKTYLEEKYKGRKEKPGRLIIAAGDEINIICRASDAFGIAKTYLDQLKKDERGTEYGTHSSCAGIAIFHSHAPYADAYKIAEECCESGKNDMKKRNRKNVCMLDFQYCQGAIGIDLESIRKDETEHIVSRPWVICPDGEEQDPGQATITEIGRMWPFLQKLGRSNVKGLAEKAYLGERELAMDLSRIKAHLSDEAWNSPIQKSFASSASEEYTLQEAFAYVEDPNQLNPQLRRRLIYDMALMYDLWFKEDGEDAEKGDD